MSDATDLYQQLVMERARRPLHGGSLDDADGAADGSNPLCGDKVHVTLRRGPDGATREIRHHTRACAICAASADLMVDRVQGLTAAEAHAVYRHFGRLLDDGPARLDAEAREQLGLLNAFADLHEYRSRRKCAILPWSALLEALGPEEQRA